MANGPWPKVFGQNSNSRHIHKLWLFPLVAGISWFATLTILLVRWLALGQPKYPGQINPKIPFISDIAAFNFQPVFIVGCAITGVTFAGTVFSVHHVRYSPEFYGLTDDARWRQITSLLALIMGLVTAACLVCLSIFDTFENNDEHRFILLCTFGGLGLAAILTTVVWSDQALGTVHFAGLRKWCLFNTLLVLVQTVIGILFIVFLHMSRYRLAGFCEWTLCYLGSFWLASFVGHTRFREEDSGHDLINERQPLLNAAS